MLPSPFTIKNAPSESADPIPEVFEGFNYWVVTKNL